MNFSRLSLIRPIVIIGLLFVSISEGWCQIHGYSVIPQRILILRPSSSYSRYPGVRIVPVIRSTVCPAPGARISGYPFSRQRQTRPVYSSSAVISPRLNSPAAAGSPGTRLQSVVHPTQGSELAHPVSSSPEIRQPSGVRVYGTDELSAPASTDTTSLRLLESLGVSDSSDSAPKQKTPSEKIVQNTDRAMQNAAEVPQASNSGNDESRQDTAAESSDAEPAVPRSSVTIRVDDPGLQPPSAIPIVPVDGDSSPDTESATASDTVPTSVTVYARSKADSLPSPPVITIEPEELDVDTTSADDEMNVDVSVGELRISRIAANRLQYGYTITNRGSTPVRLDEVVTKAFVSDNPVADLSDVEVGSLALEHELQPGQGIRCTIGVYTPDTDRKRYLVVVVDVGKRLDEVNRQNNSDSALISADASPALQNDAG